MNTNDALLIKALRLNALFSGSIGADLAAAAGSLILVASYHHSRNAARLVLIDIAAIVVLYFAIQQIRGARALDSDTRA